ncbi:MAG: D-3-phosphoglycerate dehydrogenase, partial [Bacteroidota bacterium]
AERALAERPFRSLPHLKHALVQALEQNILEGACLDTLPIENPQNWDHVWMDRLLAHPRVMVSPHVAGWTVESYKAISEVLADKIIAHLQQPTKPTNEANSRS